MSPGKLRWFAVAVALLLYSALSTAAESEIDHLVQILDLKPGSSAADVGAGSGELSIQLAGRVMPGGKVYSTEINPKLLNKISSAADKAGTRNVIVVAGTKNDTRLPADCCDAVFLREVYHHLTDPIAIDRSLYRAMRPGARLAIIDFEPTSATGPPPPGVPKNRGGHGAPKPIVLQEVTSTGFEFVKTMDWPISSAVKHYCMLFIKPAHSTNTKDAGAKLSDLQTSPSAPRLFTKKGFDEAAIPRRES
jgi:ubiquinone/menaquinone biosynthesis C-methylase UbiE